MIPQAGGQPPTDRRREVLQENVERGRLSDVGHRELERRRRVRNRAAGTALLERRGLRQHELRLDDGDDHCVRLLYGLAIHKHLTVVVERGGAAVACGVLDPRHELHDQVLGVRVVVEVGHRSELEQQRRRLLRIRIDHELRNEGRLAASAARQHCWVVYTDSRGKRVIVEEHVASGVLDVLEPWVEMVLDFKRRVLLFREADQQPVLHDLADGGVDCSSRLRHSVRLGRGHHALPRHRFDAHVRLVLLLPGVDQLLPNEVRSALYRRVVQQLTGICAAVPDRDVVPQAQVVCDHHDVSPGVAALSVDRTGGVRRRTRVQQLDAGARIEQLARRARSRRAGEPIADTVRDRQVESARRLLEARPGDGITDLHVERRRAPAVLDHQREPHQIPCVDAGQIAVDRMRRQSERRNDRIERRDSRSRLTRQPERHRPGHQRIELPVSGDQRILIRDRGNNALRDVQLRLPQRELRNRHLAIGRSRPGTAAPRAAGRVGNALALLRNVDHRRLVRQRSAGHHNREQDVDDTRLVRALVDDRPVVERQRVFRRVDRQDVEVAA